MPKPLLIISTCGTSILSNINRSLGALSNDAFNASTNCPDQASIQPEHQPAARLLLDTATQRFREATLAQAKVLSAELNAVSRINGALDPQALHYLVVTDTHFGRSAAGIAGSFLRAQGAQAEVVAIPGLSTKSVQEFEAGAKALLARIDEIAEGFGESHHIVFNLTGGFKSLLGFMTVLGNFYADEVVYIFEGGDELLRIPRLPVRLDDTLVRRHTAAFLQMAHNRFLPGEQVADIPNSLLESADEKHFGLSVWGEMLWNRQRNRVLADQLTNLPYLTYEPSFTKDFQKLDPLKRIQLQEVLAKASSLLSDSGGNRATLTGDRAGSIKYEQFSGSKKAYGHFRFADGFRVSCIATGTELRLRHAGNHDYVNDNP